MSGLGRIVYEVVVDCVLRERISLFCGCRVCLLRFGAILMVGCVIIMSLRLWFNLKISTGRRLSERLLRLLFLSMWRV